MTQSKPRVSLVTPAYNQGEYLAETIESVLAQDYPNIDYIVIDDGSTDQSLAVARRYEGRGVTVLTQANAGQAATLNRGWTQARGEWLGYLSSDDRLAPGAISALIEALLGGSGAVVAYGDFRLIDAAGKPIRDVRAEPFDLHRLTVDLVCQPGPGALFARRVFEATGGWNPRLRQVPDYDFWLRASAHGPFVKADGLLADYRIHEGSASFKPLSVDRADEIAQVVGAHWAASTDRDAARAALSNAMAIAAKHHAQSGRYRHALGYWSRSALCQPAVLTRGTFWKQVASGLLRRYYYRHRAAQA